jgi:hypothetical protein
MAGSANRLSRRRIFLGLGEKTGFRPPDYTAICNRIVVRLLVMRSIYSRKISVVAVALVTANYAAMLYFQTATASLHDEYQPGIEAMKAWISPGALLLILVAGAAFLRSSFVLQIAKSSCKAALLVCVLLFLLVSVHRGNRNTWVFPQQRSLEGTARIALFSPNFSNRSTGTVLGSAGIALLCFGASVWLCRRTQSNNSSQPTAFGGG